MVYIVIVAVLSLVTVWILIRGLTRGRNRDWGIAVSNLAMLAVLWGSLPAVADPIDRAMGDVEAWNLISHILIALIGWLMARAFLGSLVSGMISARVARAGMTFIVATVLMVIMWVVNQFIWGLPKLVHDSPLSPWYWAASFAPFIIGAPAIIAAGWKLRVLSHGGRTVRKRIHLAYVLAAIAYIVIIAATGAVFLASARPELYVVREVLIYIGPSLVLFTLWAFPMGERPASDVEQVERPGAGT